jgi:hypothetical protein
VALGAAEVAAPPSGVEPVALAGAAAIVVALLPRVGWLLTAAALVSWLAAAGHAGLALVVAAGAAPVPFLLSAAGTLWTVPALAPLLGVAGLAPLFLAAAGLAGTAWRRAGLAAAGLVQLVLAEAVLDRTLLFGAPDGVTPRSVWDGSPRGAAEDVLWPLLSSPAVLPAVAWAALAVALPLLVSGRSLNLDLLGALAWAAAAIAAHGALGRLLAEDGGRADARGLAVGSVLAAVAAIVAASAGLWRQPVAEAEVS